MEIRQVVRGSNTSFAAPRTGTAREKGAVRPAADRLELSREWAQAMEEQRARAQAALLSGGKEEKKSGGLLDMLDQPESQELDALSRQLDTQMKCMKIAANIMKGKKVPPEDERYLMENDPEGYKLAIAMRSSVKQDDEECDSVLSDEDKEGGQSSGSTAETAPAEASASGGGV